MVLYCVVVPVAPGQRAPPTTQEQMKQSKKQRVKHNRMSAHTFTCDFGNGISCTATFSRPTGTALAVNDMEWTRKPTPQEYPALATQYREWINGVREQLATQWGMTMLAALCVEEGRTEMWKFTPNQPAQLIEVIPGNLP